MTPTGAQIFKHNLENAKETNGGDKATLLDTGQTLEVRSQKRFPPFCRLVRAQNSSKPAHANSKVKGDHFEERKEENEFGNYRYHNRKGFQTGEDL